MFIHSFELLNVFMILSTNGNYNIAIIHLNKAVMRLAIAHKG